MTDSQPNTLTKRLEAKIAEGISEERDLLRSLRDLLIKQEFDELTIEQVGGLMAHLEELFLLVVVGEVKSGKSSFINALLNADVCKVGAIPTTDKIHILKYGETERERIVEDYLIERQLPFDALRNINIVDTPGTNSIITRHAEITESFIPRCDLVLFNTSVDRPFSATEKEFLGFIVEGWAKKIVFCLTKMDIKEPHEIEEIVGYVRDQVKKFFDFDPRIFCVSAKLARKAIKAILMGKQKTVAVTKRNLGKWAGIKKFRFGEIESHDMVGVTTGLAWTEVGGELLSIESVIVPGKGKMTYTGKLGDVMTESIQAAKSYVQSRARQFGIHPTLFRKKDIHVHVPEGATPKDGPSAGVAMVTSIVSVLTGIKVKRNVAMTGEVTLRGRVLPIGGLKEKLLAALRGGITTVLIPQENEKDLAEIPDNVKRGLKIIPVVMVEEVLEHSLVSELTPMDWDEEAELEASALAAAADDDGTDVVTH